MTVRYQKNCDGGYDRTQMTEFEAVYLKQWHSLTPF